VIQLAPAVSLAAACPKCARPLAATGWYMPGMRVLGRARCAECRAEYLVDLAAGQARYSPGTLDLATGAVHDPAGVEWFARWLKESYRSRGDAPVGLEIARYRPLTRRVLLLNCIDTLYGHAVLKLFNAQQYIDGGEVDVIVVVQPFLRWMVPDGVAECWTVDIPLREGTMWSDGLARDIAAACAPLPDLYLAPAFSHPHPSTFEVENFSRVSPFALSAWASSDVAAVTFIWRDDRLWTGERVQDARRTPLMSRLRGRVGGASVSADAQREQVVKMFDALKVTCAPLDAAVVGVGAPGGLPEWIRDMRALSPTDALEREWCGRYAASHAVVGVHGSNMLLPSAHAGSTVELLGHDRTGNFLQDIVFNGVDARDLHFRYRFLSPDTPPEEVAAIVAFIVRRYPDFVALMGRDQTRDPDASREPHVRH